MKKKRKVKKRLIALNIGLIAVILFSFLYISIAGDHYTLHTRFFTFEGDESPTEFTVLDESVLKLKSVYKSPEGEILADFESVGKGKTEVAFCKWFGEEKGEPEIYEFTVNRLGTIIDVTMGRISFNGLTAILIAIILLLLMTGVIMVWMFIDYCRNGDFCYPMIACGGVAIYVFILLAYVVYYMVYNTIISFSFFLMLVTDAGLIMLILLTPIMLTLAALMAVSNIWLMRNEGYRPVNALGIAFAILSFIAALMTVGVYMIPYFWDIPAYNILSYIAIYIAGYLDCMFISTVISSYLATRYRPPLDRDYIIILGCAIRSDGTPTPLLKARVDSALDFAREQLEKTGKSAVYVPSGGQGSDELISEGESMENYLLSVGAPADGIAREDKSTNTYENMKFSKEVIDAHSGGRDVKIAFATTNYHVFRGYILAKKLGFEAKGISAKTKIYFFPNAFLREFVGLLVDQKWKHLFFIILIVTVFILLKYMG